nr:MAG TPA: tail tape measure protein [Caudoviricetes sp.]
MNVYELSASLVLRTDDFEDSLARAGKQTSAFGDVLKANLVSEAIISGIKKIASAVLDVGKASLAAYGDYEQLVGGAQLMFGDAYDYISDRSRQAYKNVQMSQNDYLRQVNGFATGLKTSMGGNAKAAAELADKIVTAEADVVAATGNSQEAVQNAFNGIMRNNYTMLDNLQLGIVPTKEGFESLIAKVNEWNEQNGRMTDYTIDNLADCQQALVDYIEMQGLSGYAAMEASGTLQGSVSSVRAAWEDLLAAIGSGDQTSVKSATDALLESLETAAENIVPIVRNIFDGFVDAFSAAHDRITDTSTAAGAAISAIEALAVGIGTAWTATKLWNIATAAASAILAHPIAAVAIASIALLTVKILEGRKALADFEESVRQTTIKEDNFNSLLYGIKESAIEIMALREATEEHTGIFGHMDDDSLASALLAEEKNYNDLMVALLNMSPEAYDMLVHQGKSIDEVFQWNKQREELAAAQADAEAKAQGMVDSAQSFSDSAQQILTSYWNTYNSIYTGLFNAANVFTQVTEATKFGDAEKNQTGAEELRGNLEANTRFYEQYASDLEYVQGAAADAGVDLSALMEILGSMSTEDAAGAIASIREELELAGNDEERAKFINNWDSLLQDYSTAVSGATQPLAEAATGVHDQLNALLEEYTKSVEGMDQSEEAVAAAKATLDGLIFGIDQNTSGVLSSLDVLTSEMQSKLQADFADFVLTIQAVVGLSDTPDGSHRSGLDYVPFDGYMAQLHAGERVLTASEASAYRNGNRGGSAVPIEITIPLTLDGEQIGRAAAQYAWSEDRRNGI